MPAISNGLTMDTEILNLLKTAGAPLEAAFVRLFANNFTPTKGSPIGDFIEAAFDGYATLSLLAAGWSLPYLNVAGNREMSTLGQQVFTSSGMAAPQTIYGWYITDPGATAWYMAERFSAPVPLGVVTGDRLGLILRAVQMASGLDGSASLIS